MAKLPSLIALAIVLFVGASASAQEVEWSKHKLEGLRAFEEKRYADAEKSFKAAVKAAEKLGLEHLPLSQVLTSLSETQFQLRKYADAKKTLRRAIGILEKLLGPEDLEVARHWERLAEVYFAEGDAGPIIFEFRVDAGILNVPPAWTSLSGSFYLVSFAMPGLQAVPDAYMRLRFPNAESALKRALSIREKVLPETDPDVTRNLSKLARIYSAEQRYKEAIPLLERVAAILEKTLGPGNLQFARSLTGLGYVHFLSGNLAEAESLFRRSLAIHEAEPEPNLRSVAIYCLLVAEMACMQAKYAEAEPLYQRVLGLLEQTGGHEHAEMLGTLRGYAELLRKTGRKTEAKELEDRAEAIIAAIKKEREEAFRRRKQNQK